MALQQKKGPEVPPRLSFELPMRTMPEILRPYIVMFSTLENSRKILLKVITRPWDLCTLGPWVKLCLQCDHTN